MFWTEKCPKKDSDVFFFTEMRFVFFFPERYTASSGAERFRKSGRWKREDPIIQQGGWNAETDVGGGTGGGPGNPAGRAALGGVAVPQTV